MKRLRLTLSLLAAAHIFAGSASGGSGPTPAEKQALATLGRGVVVYEHNGMVVRFDLDSSGGEDTTILYDAESSAWPNSPVPCIGATGQYVYYRICPDNINCEIWRMGIDGTNAAKLCPDTYPFAQHLRQRWQTPDMLVFCSSISPKAGLWNHPTVYTMDGEGNVELVLDLGTSISDNLDLSANLLAYRKDRSKLYVYNMDTESHTEIRVGCGESISPDTSKLIVNKGGHKGYWLYGRTGSNSWELVDSAEYEMQLNPYRWSNHNDWLTIRTEGYTPPMAFARNIVTGDQVRISFYSDTGHVTSVNLFLEEALTENAHSRHDLPATAWSIGTGRANVYDIAGRQVGGLPVGPAQWRGSEARRGVYVYQRAFADGSRRAGRLVTIVEAVATDIHE